MQNIFQIVGVAAKPIISSPEKFGLADCGFPAKPII
jgi:hypothetical protein